MTDQVEVSKVTEFVTLGSPADTLVVSKLVMFVILYPGDSGEAAPRQAHVYAQIIARD